MKFFSEAINLPLLNEGFDASVRDGRTAKPIRVTIAVILAAVAATGLGWKPMAIWLAVSLAWEVYSGWSLKRNPYPVNATWRRRAPMIAVVVAVNVLWMIPSIMMWLSGSPALQVAAIVQWLANLMYVQLYSQKSRLFAFLSATPQILIIAYCALFHSPFSGWEAVAPLTVINLALFNIALGLTATVVRQEGMVAAVAAREESEARMREALTASEASELRFRLAAAMVKMQVWEIDFRSADRLAASAKLRDRIHPDDQETVEAALQKAFDTNTRFHLTHRFGEGAPHWVESVAEMIRDADGAPLKIVGAYRDIDHEKAVEQELVQARDAADAASQAKSHFLATISHEIRTPLNGVLGMAQAMAADRLSKTQRQRLTIVQQSGETLLALLNDVLDLSKIEAGKMDLEEAEFDLGEVIHSAHAAFAGVAAEKNLGLSLHIDAAAQGVYLGDPTRLRQVLYNLISNGLKFTQAGEVVVDAARAGDDLVVTVRDSGIGIAPDRLAALFTDFTQAEASTSRRFGGTGLGLSICKSLIELMGGEILVTSQPGEGSTFVVRLPLPRLRDKDSAPVVADQAAHTDAAAPEIRILAAEDNLVNQLVLSTLLEQLGLAPVLVSNGREAVEAWARESWDIILMDMQMPEMNGLAATRLIRDREAAEGRARTPIIALTADALSHQAEEYRSAGIDGLVSKPIQLTQLITAIGAQLEPALAEAQPT